MHHYVFSTTEFCAFIVFLKSNSPFISLTTVCNYISAPDVFKYLLTRLASVDKNSYFHFCFDIRMAIFSLFFFFTTHPEKVLGEK